jgi:membrane fusion protein (multidrug efflux system)
VRQARTKLNVALQNLAQAKLNLSYCDIVADIDGVVTNRSVNPGNNVIAGQSLMAIRSLTDIWVDANFKETQLADLRIGQEADLDVDMYGRRRHFTGRISGFTMGTGSTLALLPPENATGNFVKVVQRLPVRIDLTDYDPDKNPLFVGLSVTPTVYLRHPLSGPDQGKVLQPYVPSLPTTNPTPSVDPDLDARNYFTPIDLPPIEPGNGSAPPSGSHVAGLQGESLSPTSATPAGETTIVSPTAGNVAAGGNR